MVNPLYQCVWYPKLYVPIIAFWKEFEVCTKIKDSTAMPSGSVQLQTALHKRFYLWSLDFVSMLPKLHNLNIIQTVVD